LRLSTSLANEPLHLPVKTNAQLRINL
jgi:hypothetical protein